MSLSEQFYGEYELAAWIKEKYNKTTIEKLIDRVKYKKNYKATEPEIWTIGPKEHMAGLWLYYSLDSRASTTIVISITIIDQFTIVVFDGTKWIKLHKSRAASSFAQKLDFLLNLYTKIPMLHMNEFFSALQEINGE